MVTKVQVATKIILLNEKNEVLLLVRGLSDPFAPGELDLPGGKVNLWESPLDGAKRETLEETGIEVPNIKTINTWSFEKWDIQVVGITFFERFQTTPEVVLSFEHDEYMWMSLDELAKIDTPDWIQRIPKVLSQLWICE